MISELRNPKLDPQKGDVFRKKGLRREIIYREFNGMAGDTLMADKVQCLDGGWIKPAREVRPSLKQFRRWAVKSFVEKVG